MVRNKANDFAGKINFDRPRAKDEYASQKPNGSIRNHPQERMGRSSQRFQ
jgi:small acid-soluble spore protein K (minor)